MTMDAGSRGQSRTLTGKVLLVTLIVAVLLGAVAFFAARGSTAAVVEGQQADAVYSVVARAQTSGGGSYSVITDAIEQLDQTGDDQYWLLANHGTILYVKDVNTSNAYRGLPVADYPGGAELQGLLDSAPLGGAAHATVPINGTDYLASATSFNFSGSTYNLCVLADTATLRSASPSLPTMLLYAVLAIALVLLVVVPTLVAAKLEGARDVVGAGLVRAMAKGAGGEAAADAPAAAAAVPAEAAAAAAPAGAAAETVAAPTPAPTPVEAAPAAEAVAAAEPAAKRVYVPDFDPIPLRPESELAGHLQRLLDEGVSNGNLIRIACRDAGAMDRVRRHLAALANGSNANCFAWGEDSLLVELYDIDAESVRAALSHVLQDDAEIVAFVPITPA